jgi:hypothetical protein
MRDVRILPKILTSLQKSYFRVSSHPVKVHPGEFYRRIAPAAIFKAKIEPSAAFPSRNFAVSAAT